MAAYTADNECKQKLSEPTQFASFAVLDLETTGLAGFGAVNITELSIYGVSLKELHRIAKIEEFNKSNDCVNATNDATICDLPKRPRVLHKLTLVPRPRMLIHPKATELTGLDNFMLENDSLFDENAANTVLGFLSHLQQPICLVAHNGNRFDFPIFKGAFEKLHKSLPDNLLCVDSMQAFRTIDKLREMEQSAEPEPSKDVTLQTEWESKAIDELLLNAQIDWQAINERTPSKRHTGNVLPSSSSKYNSSNLIEKSKRTKLSMKAFKSRRALFTLPNGKPILPAKGVYKQVNIYERIFGQPPSNAHYAESDVEALLQIIQYYGEDFVSYANEHAQPLNTIKSIVA